MITYIIKFILCSGLLLLVYRVFLGNERLYRFNRFYLLFSLVFSLAVPFVTISVPTVQLPYLDGVVTTQVPSTSFAAIEQPVPVNIDEPILQQNTPTVITDKPVQQQIVQTPATDYLPYVLLGVYGMAVVILLVRFARNSWHISHLVTKNIIVDYQDTKLVLIDEEVTPHSFLNYVFINKDAYQSGEVEPQIICHEQAHVRQLHSLDVIFVELLQVVFWFNPFIPFYRKAIQLNHEFLADEAVIESYQDTPAYQYLLLEKASQCGSLYLTSQFNYLITKKRLIMMTKNTSAKIAVYKKLAMLPLLATVILLFSQKSTAGILQDVKSNEDTKLAVNKITHKEYNARLEKYKQQIKSEVSLNVPTNQTPAQKPAQKGGKIVFTKNKAVRIQSKGKKPVGELRFPINYPSTKEGASPELIKEYEVIIAKYFVEIPVGPNPEIKGLSGVIARDKAPAISDADRSRLESIFSQMSKEQQKQQKLAFSFSQPFPLGVPSQKQINTWANDKQYKITIDGKLSDGAELAKHKATDFSHFYKAHIEWQVHRKYKYQKYEIQLMTTDYFNTKNEERTTKSHMIYNYRVGSDFEVPYIYF